MAGSGTPDKTRKRVESLRKLIREHDHRYYVLAAPSITDRQYDALMDELRQFESEHPELATPDSPTQRVGGEPIEGFEHVTHAVPMRSIDNTYDEAAVREFDARVRKGLDGEAYQYVIDPKIDGVAISLRYESGRLVLAATRGDGQVGDDVTHSVRTIRAVPIQLSGDRIPDVLEIRGEVYWPREAFDRFNKQREEAGEPLFANPRNATAGTLKQLDPRNVAGRGLSFIAHGYGQVEPMRFKRLSELFDAIESWGVPANRHRSIAKDVDAVAAAVHEWDARRRGLPYETDGLVIKVDDIEQQAALGATSRYPRWCIAYKFAAERAESVIRQIDFQVGKLGTITPRAVMDPVPLSGTTVRHASLHNFDQVERLDVRVGDTVIVEKAGEIIPQVIEVVMDKRPRGARKTVPPTECPVCRGTVARDEGGVYIRCINPECPKQITERLIHFAGRNQMDIEGAGGVLIETLVEKRYVKTFADLYRLDRDTLFALKLGDKQFGGKKTDSLLAGLERSKGQPLSRVLAALNIRHVGGTSAELLAEHFGDMQALADAGEDELMAVDGIGPELAASIREFFGSEPGLRTWQALRDAGVNMTQPRARRSADQPLAGKTVVVTGTLERFTRGAIQDKIKSLGGKVASSVSKKTDLVLIGESPGGKADKAGELGVEILDEGAFVDRYGGNP
ncbi:MAG: NAD-dependent DNA ligase LigA [Phycisphaerales bacterium]|nr:NAD-dependent DNA ligase LigA [Phycisphaerales bacterium]